MSGRRDGAGFVYVVAGGPGGYHLGAIDLGVTLRKVLEAKVAATKPLAPRPSWMDCYAALAETWLGVPAGDLLPRSLSPSVGSPILRLGILCETR